MTGTAAGIFLLAGIIGGQVHAQNHHAEGLSASSSTTISRTGSFELDMTPEKALPLFTAPGEKLWVPGWDPVILSGDGFEKGTAFVTAHHGHTTYWLVMDYDTRAHRALYVRVTPERDMGTVEVSILPNRAGGSTVRVAYRLTGLSSAGNQSLEESFNERSYARMMEEWRAMIDGSREKIDAHFSAR